MFKPNEKKSVQRKGASPAIPTKAVRPNVRHSPAPSQASVLTKKSNPSPLNKYKDTKKVTMKYTTLVDITLQWVVSRGTVIDM